MYCPNCENIIIVKTATGANKCNKCLFEWWAKASARCHPMYQLFTIGWKGDDIFIGTFTTLENAQKRVEQMCLRRRTWVELDQLDDPVDEQNIVWEIPGTCRYKKSAGII